VNALKAFRLLVIAEILLTILSVVLAFLPVGRLPPAVEDYLDEEGASPLMQLLDTDSVGLLVTVCAILAAFVGAYVASLIGLLMLKHWARMLYVAIFIAGVALYPFMGAAIAPPVSSTVDYLLSACSGAIVALLCMNSVREHFTHA
jgi:hypothetical protein